MKVHQFILAALLLSIFRLTAIAQTDGIPSPLQDAVRSNDTNAVLAALRAHPDAINATNEDGWTALHTAAFSGKTKPAKVLLEHGASPDLTDPDGERPLSLAAANGYAEIIRMLLAAGAKPSTP